MRRSLPLIASLILLPSPALTLVACAAVNPALEKPTKQQVASKTTIAQNANQSAPELAPEKQQDLQELTQAITVKISSSNNGGSGVLIGREGNEYLILTNAHVVRGGETFEIQTSDGQVHPGSLVQDATNSNDDLALVKFSSSQEYETVTISTVPLETEILTYAGGYASETGTLVTKTGKISQYPDQSLKEGYRIGFTSDIEQGMSGGPILDAVEEELIGINGQGTYPILNTPYVYRDGTAPSQSEIETMRQLSWGIPINTFLAQVNSDILTAHNLPLPETTTGVVTAYTGWIGELEKKAQQITVRIDSDSGANGSGVIIAQEGNIYTVLTAAHVVCERNNATQPCDNRTYQILAPDGETYPVEPSTIKRQDGVDLAVVKFNSNENFQVAQIANYPFQSNDAVFVAGYPRFTGDTTAKWLFSLGYGVERETGLISVNDNKLFDNEFFVDSSDLISSQSSLAGGYEMLYTSITSGGMSGGAVLDRDGRVIGIHGAAESETDLDSQGSWREKVQLGHSLGIPINTFIGLADIFEVNASLPIQDNRPRALNSSETKVFDDAILGIEIPKENATAEVWLERGNQLWRLKRFDEAVEAFDKVIALNPEFVHLAHYGKGFALALTSKDKEEVALASLELATESNPHFTPAFSLKSLVLQNLKRFDEALVAIGRAITLQKDNANFHHSKGRIFSDSKRYSEAEIAFSQAIKIFPNSGFYYDRGIVYGKQGKLELALADYNRTLQINPHYAFAYNNRGLVYDKQGKLELALADYNRAIEINPQLFYPYANRGIVYDKQGKLELALADYNRAIEINPQSASFYYGRGLVYDKQGKLELALADYNRAIEINPQSASAYFSRGQFYNKQGKLELALADYNRALELNPQNAGVYNDRGIVYDKQGKLELALADYNRALELNPQNAGVYESRGFLHREQGKLELALADYNRAIEINPQYATAYNNRGLLYREQGKLELAVADFNRAIEINPQYATAYNNRGNLYREQGKLELALADYNRALELNPQYATAYNNRGLLYEEQGSLELALADYNRAIEINPQYATAYNNRGLLYGKQELFVEARFNLQKAQQLFTAQGDTARAEKVANLLQKLP